MRIKPSPLVFVVMQRSNLQWVSKILMLLDKPWLREVDEQKTTT